MVMKYFKNFLVKGIRVVARVIGMILPIKKNKIVFDNFSGRDYGGNPKYIAEELRSRGLNLDLVWMTRNPHAEYPQGIRTVRYYSFASILEAATAKVWVDNVRAAHLTKKKKNQIYMQTWHASFTPKKIEKDAEDKLLPIYVKKAKIDGYITDAILSNSKLLDEQYRRTFWLNEKTEILKIGLPRNDILFIQKLHRNIKKKVTDRYNLDDDDYLILYAPTFRDDGSIKGYELPYEAIRLCFEAKTKKKCKLLLRFHPNVNVDELSITYTEYLINAFDYPDAQELVIASNAVISDYSTIIFDFAIMKKPVFLHTLDIDEYCKIRGLLPEYYDLPFSHTYHNEDLLKAISEFSYIEYSEKLCAYFSENPIYDNGKASKLAVDWILLKMQEV